MTNPLATAAKLDWSAWIRGLVGAAVSGGAGAVGATFGTMALDGKDFNFTSGLTHTLQLMGICFLISGLVSLMKFLQSHPTPDPVQDAK